MKKFILIFFIFILSKHIYSSEAENKLLVQLIDIIENKDLTPMNELPDLYFFLKQEDISLNSIDQALKFAQNELEKARQENNRENRIKYANVVKLLEKKQNKIKIENEIKLRHKQKEEEKELSETIKSELSHYFPPEISGIIQEYSRDPIKIIEEQIEKVIIKIFSFVDKNLIDSKIARKLFELKNLNLKDKISTLRNLAQKLNVDDEIFEEIKDYTKHDQFFSYTPTEYLQYKYLYTLLDDRTIKEHKIESPEELKNRFLSNPRISYDRKKDFKYLLDL